jgi:hypothetical protein
MEGAALHFFAPLGGFAGRTGYFLSARAVFFVAAALLGPALLALRWISWREIDPKRAHGGPPEPGARTLPADLLKLVRSGLDHLRRLHHAVPSRQCRDASADGRRVGNPFEPMGDDLDRGMHRWPQLVVALFSPWIGRKAQTW